MNNLIFFAIFGLCSIQAMACRPLLEEYFRVNGKIYFGTPDNQWTPVVSNDKIPSYQLSDTDVVEEESDYYVCIEDADKETLEINTESHFYAQDKHHVYYRGETIADADPASFVLLGGIYTSFGEKYGYAKDKQSVFYECKKITAASTGSFRIIDRFNHYLGYSDDAYAMDENHVFSYGAVTHYDPASFAILGWSYTADKNGIYSNKKLIADTAGKEYKINGPVLICDGKVYFTGTEMKLFDADSYQVIHSYFKEATSCGGILLGGILGQDKNGIYINNQNLDWLDRNTFEKVDSYRIKDKNGTYQFIYPSPANQGKELFEKIK